MKYENLFSPIKVGNTILKNRVVMPPMDTNSNNMDGSLSRKCFEYYSERARGGAGLIIMEAVSVDFPYGKISARQINMKDSKVISDMHDLVEVVHSFGGKIIPQLHHGGFMAVPEYCNGEENISASDMSDPFPPARAMTVEEIQHVIEQFVAAAVNAQKAGFDGVEIHASHMYLLNQFISPLTNHRTDEYGGTMENRMRIVVEITKQIREKCGNRFLISVRLGVKDAVPGGIELKDGAIMAKMCEEAGADLINCTTGIYLTLEMMTEGQYQEEGARLYFAKAIKEAVSTAKIAIVGKLRTPEFCEQAIKNGDTDLVCIGRQLICDPFWAIKAEVGRENEIRACLNCDEGCLHQFYNLKSNVRCVLNPYVGFEDLYQESNVRATGIRKNIVIIGGGVAGMQAAITATRKGHSVTIVEKSDKLGGQMILASVPPHKEVLHTALEWFTGEVERLGIKVVYNVDATAEIVKGYAPDAVIVAVGAIPTRPPVDGVEKATVSWDILENPTLVPEKKNIVVIGGGVVGCEVAHMFVEKENHVTIIEMLPDICNGQEPLHKGCMEEALKAANANIQVNAMTLKVNDNSVEYKNAEGEIISADSDLTIVATGQKSMGADLVKKLRGLGIHTYSVGDATSVGNIRTATRSGFDIAESM